MNPEVFKQAQSRGWMAGWEYSHHYDMNGEVRRYTFKQDRGSYGQKNVWTKSLSINDILFGTDFCEKNFDENDGCVKGTWTHQEMMLSMSESERIAFLEKHLEVKEEPQKYPNITIEQVNKWHRVLPIHVLSNSVGWCEVHQREYRPDSHTLEYCEKQIEAEKTQPKEIDHIRKFTYNIVNGCIIPEKESINMLIDKIRELVDQTNANTRALREKNNTIGH